MAESSSWSDVGERFSHLGRTLQDSWTQAGDDGLADNITRTANDHEVHASARAAAGGLVDALSNSLSDLANRIQSPKD